MDACVTVDARAPRAWLFNFDAEAELADPSRGTPSRAFVARSEALVEKLASLLAPGDVVITEGTRADGHRGRAWCPTPRALAAIARAGAEPPRAPPVDVLRGVSHRRFCAELGLTLPGARWAATRAEVDHAIRASEGRWLLRRPYGFAGRESLRVAAARLTSAEERWIAASFEQGEGLLVEPWVERAGDFGLHGHLGEDGALVLGSPTLAICDERGAWRESRRAPPDALAPSELEALVRATTEAARALTAAGYFGPFGVDAFRYRDATGALAWNPRCEINARYSMGWATGMGERRPDLDEASPQRERSIA
jgi:hypothetical protein